MQNLVDVVTQWTGKLKSQVACVTKETFVGITETFSFGRSHQSLFRGAFRRATCDMMTSMLKYEGVCEALKTVIIQVATSGSVVQVTAKKAIRKEKLLAVVARLVPERPEE